jgi:hypothetical protein
MVPLSDVRVLHGNIFITVLRHPDFLASDTHPGFLDIRYVAEMRWAADRRAAPTSRKIEGSLELVTSAHLAGFKPQ